MPSSLLAISSKFDGFPESVLAPRTYPPPNILPWMLALHCTIAPRTHQTSTGAPPLDRAVIFALSNISLGTITSRNKQSSVILGSSGARFDANSKACCCCAWVTLKDEEFPATRASRNSYAIGSQLGSDCGHTLPSLPSWTTGFFPLGGRGAAQRTGGWANLILLKL
jgi:hypothetical protein